MMSTTKRDTIELAREAGLTGLDSGGLLDNFKTFEALVRADEREACAKVCDEVGLFHEVSQGADLAFDLAAAIRARGNT
jgi:hypothetical protein